METTKLTQEQAIERIKLAKKYVTTGWTGKTEPIEVSISSQTAKDMGYDAIDIDALYRKVDKSGKTLDGYYWLNANCPVATNEEEAIAIFRLFGKSLIEAANATAKTVHGNSSRAIVNRQVESKKLVEKANKQSQMDALKAKVQTGEITQEDYLKECIKIAGFSL